jgi:hypothetical protein
MDLIGLLIINIVLMFVVVYLRSLFNQMVAMTKKEAELAAEQPVVADTFTKINAILTDAVPIEEEYKILMDHEYDGIQELDNNLPPWWVWGFVACIIFTFVYIINYHVLGVSDLQIEAYEKEMDKAQKKVSGFSSGMKKMGGMLAGAFAVGALVSYGKHVANAADAQNKLARRLGITKNDVDALELSFTKGGQSLEGSEKALDIFNRRLGELESGSKGAADMFERAGLAARDFVGLGYVDRLINVKKSLDGMTTSARAFASQELFGRGGAKIYEGLSALEDTQAMIKDINNDLGLTGDQVKGIEEMNDAYTELKKKLT